MLQEHASLETTSFAPAIRPIAFPAQNLKHFEASSRRFTPHDRTALGRRTAVFSGAALITGYLSYELYHVLSLGGLTQLELVLIGLFVVNIAWLALSFMTALAGFAVLAFGLRPSLLDLTGAKSTAPLSARTAILICTYNESPERIFGTALATMKTIAAEGQSQNFDIFVLSDTTDPDIWVQEEAAFQAVRARRWDGPGIYYRRRSHNAGKKAGNVADWCRQWGSAYDYMVVLDADSLMTGDALVRLVAAIDAEPDIGLIQTVPVTMGRNTLFARLQQFAGRLYGPVMAAGLAFWHRGTGNFWGHNAIIRVCAFIDSAGLPPLPGAPPFGGPIMSHDFVEAALLCRAGWRVCMVPELQGSYEESPPSLIDSAMRDRRWCQGNLQHSRILAATGLRGTSRVHLAMGIMAYLSALIWLLFLITALALTLQEQSMIPVYFTEGQTLYPSWPMQDSERAMGLLFWTLLLLLLPKLFGTVLVLARGHDRAGFGGVWRLTAGVVIETVLSSLIAHIMMLVQSMAILDILRGRDSGWKPQHRDDGSLPRAMIFRYHRNHMLLGLLLLVGTLSTAPELFLWLLPAMVGLLFAGPLSAASASQAWGEAFRRTGLLTIPEETAPPAIAVEARDYGVMLAREVSRNEAISHLLHDPQLRRLHLELIQMQPVTRDARISPNLAVGWAKLEISSDVAELLALLNPGEKAALLSDPRSISRLEAMMGMQAERAGEAVAPGA